MNQPAKIDQTIFTNDPYRPSNCFAAAVATAVGKPLEEVPHFVEHGQIARNGKLKDDGDKDLSGWWLMFCGYVAALGLWPVPIGSMREALPDEVVFVSGIAASGVRHQVLYKNGELWHNPHPSRAEVVPDMDYLFVLRAGVHHDHEASA